MIGFEKAMEAGFTHIELDVQLSRDNIPVVIHDLFLNRTTNGSGLVRTHTLKQLKKLDAGQGRKIPTLEEVLTAVKGKAVVNIELKQMGNFYPGLEQKVVECVAETGMDSDVLITSFDHYSIQKVNSLQPALSTGLIVSGVSPFLAAYARSIGSQWIALNYRYINQQFVEECRQHQIGVIVWTVDREEEMELMWQQFPDVMICTNNLEGAKQVWERIGQGRWYESRM